MQLHFQEIAERADDFNSLCKNLIKLATSDELILLNAADVLEIQRYIETACRFLARNIVGCTLYLELILEIQYRAALLSKSRRVVEAVNEYTVSPQLQLSFGNLALHAGTDTLSLTANHATIYAKEVDRYRELQRQVEAIQADIEKLRSPSQLKRVTIPYILRPEALGSLSADMSTLVERTRETNLSRLARENTGRLVDAYLTEAFTYSTALIPLQERLLHFKGDIAIGANSRSVQNLNAAEGFETSPNEQKEELTIANKSLAIETTLTNVCHK